MDKYFEFRKHGTDMRTEILAGITTFLATMYIIVVNPAIISSTGMPFNGVLTATVLVSAFSSIAMGFYARNPILVAPGMGLNAFFTYTVVLGMQIPWQTALGAVFWSGIIFILLSIFNIRTQIVKAIPTQLRYAIAAGIGLFITLIGFTNAGFIVDNQATLISRGGLTPSVLTFLVGFCVTAILVVKRNKGALICGIVFTTLAAIPMGRIWGADQMVQWQGLMAMPDFSVFFQLDLVGSLKLSLIPVFFAFLFTDMFDSLSTFVGVAEAGNLKDEDGEPRNIRESLIVDGLSTMISGLFGTSSGTSYIESATGIEEGGRTGMTAVVAGLLFLPFMFLSPLLSIVPAIATAPALVIVGVFMIRPVTMINWTELDNAIPAFLAMFLIPATYSITQGIIWGFLSWTVIKFTTGKRHEITPALLLIDLFAILSLVLG
ncbi:MAG: NCS2 family permease [Desulfobulbaceae bacterium]|uniref:NCS2 family permease n=1 Tax=Candidatus Desulfatifera sulfidica TaxID=2841691 RepID=A0A8J6TCK9_9BACT|nr:NCS2 family permease [Candidatus Desulfatifera sulfidica]